MEAKLESLLTHVQPALYIQLSEDLHAVNIGDGLARWTDGLLKSTYHRVRAPKITDNKVWKGIAAFCHAAVGICCLQA